MNAIVKRWSAVRETARSSEENALSSRNSDVKTAVVLDIVAANRNMRIVNVAVDQIAHNAGWTVDAFAVIAFVFWWIGRRLFRHAELRRRAMHFKSWSTGHGKVCKKWMNYPKLKVFESLQSLQSSQSSQSFKVPKVSKFQSFKVPKVSKLKVKS